MPLPNQEQPKGKGSFKDSIGANMPGGQGTGVKPASDKNPWVYLGPYGPPSQPGVGQVYAAPNVVTYEEASKLWYSWDEKDRAKFRSSLALTGIDTKGMADAEYAAAWDAYVKQAAAYYRGGAGKKLTPWDILATDRRYRESEAVAKPKTVTSTSLNLSTREDAMGIASAVSQQLLGRDMTPAEVDQLLKKLNAAEKANPSTTTQTTNADGTQQTSITTGGFTDTGRGAIAEEQAKGSEGYAEYQAATTLYGALMEMM